MYQASALTHRGAGHCGVDRGNHLLPAIAQVADTDTMHALLGWCQKDSKRTDEPWVHRILAAHFELPIRAWAFQVQIMQQLGFPRWDLIRMVCSEDCKRWRGRRGDWRRERGREGDRGGAYEGDESGRDCYSSDAESVYEKLNPCVRAQLPTLPTESAQDTTWRLHFDKLHHHHHSS